MLQFDVKHDLCLTADRLFLVRQAGADGKPDSARAEIVSCPWSQAVTVQLVPAEVSNFRVTFGEGGITVDLLASSKQQRDVAAACVRATNTTHSTP